MAHKKSITCSEYGQVSLKSALLLLFLLFSSLTIIILYDNTISVEARDVTLGQIRVVDREYLLNCTIEVYSPEGELLEQSDDANKVYWDKVPIETVLSFNASLSKGISVDFTLSGDSPNSIIFIDNYGLQNPTQYAPPGDEVKYFEVKASNLSYSEEKIILYYSDHEVINIDETTLSIFSYRNSSWVKLKSEIDVENNFISFSNNYDSSVFVMVSYVQDDSRLFGTLGVSALEADNNFGMASEKGAANSHITLSGSVVDRNGSSLDVNMEVELPVLDKTGGLLPFSSGKISSMSVSSHQPVFSSDKFSIKNVSTNSRIKFDALGSKNVSASFALKGNVSNARIVLDDYGVNNP
ncbi:MAG: hypothetical protein KAI86_11480, partial [Desulfobacterales bacterium]|nr:hypothetical protein [Desulfobacterales bacterium]